MRRVVLACFALLLFVRGLDAYNILGYSWPSGNIVMHLQLGSSGGVLIDGYPSWGASAEGALAGWNQQIGRSQFTVVRDSTTPIGSPNGTNSVFFSSSIFGSPFGSSTLAVTRTWSQGGTAVESDVVFNTAFAWNSYAGNLRPGVIDIHRVAMHEFGHVLGLGHPDQIGQNVSALMNAFISNLDTITADDIAGAQVIYGPGVPPAPPTADSVTPASGTGSSQVFTMRYSHPNGATNIATAWTWFSSSKADGFWLSSCFMYYQRSTNTLHLLNNAGTGYSAGTLGSGGTLQNSQCSVALANSSASTGGTTLTVNLAVTFSTSFTGPKNIYMDAVAANTLTSGWPDRGDWTVPAPSTPTLSAVSVTPGSGSGATQTFAIVYSDSLGATDIATAWLWFTPAFSTSPSAFTNTCFLFYRRATNQLNLLDSAGSGYVVGTLGSGTLQNGQCSVNLAGSSAAVNGNDLTLTLPIAFNPSTFSGAKNVFIDTVSNGGTSSGWPDRGDWTIPASPAPGVAAVSVTPSSGSGASQTFAFLYSDSQGATDIATAWIWFGPATFTTTPSAFQNTCFMYYQRATNTLSLLDDTATAYVSGRVGGSGTVQNGRCSVNLAGSSVTINGDDLTLNLPMTFAASFAGAKNVFIDAVNNGGTTSGWPDRGDWTVPAGSVPVSAVSVTPNTGSGSGQSFTFLYSDTAGATDIATAWIWFGPATFTTAPSAFVNTCFLYLQRASNTLHLLNDAATGYVSGTIGSAVTLQNGQCSVNLAGSSMAANGGSLSLTLPMTFATGAFAGTKNIFMDAVSNAGASSGWPDRGDWTVP